VNGAALPSVKLDYSGRNAVMSKGHSPRFSYRHILDAECLTVGDAAAREVAIARDVFRHGKQGETVAEGYNVFLTREQVEERKRLTLIAKRREKSRLKAIRRAAEGKPYGQGAYTRIVPDGEREPVEHPAKYVTVGKPKPHGARPSGYVCATYTGVKR
jgi:hypothetical protein